MGGRPIAHKYRKGKMQRTLKREFEELEVVEREAIAVSEGLLGGNLKLSILVISP